MDPAPASFSAAVQHVDRRIKQDQDVPDVADLLRRGASGGDVGYSVRDGRSESASFLPSKKIAIPQVLLDELNHILCPFSEDQIFSHRFFSALFLSFLRVGH